MTLEISERMLKNTDIVDELNNNEGLGLLPPQAAFFTPDRNCDWSSATAAISIDTPDGVRIQTIDEPFHPDTEEDILSYALEVLNQSVDRCETDTDEYLMDARHSIEILRRRFYQELHDVDSSNMHTLLSGAARAGCTPGQIMKLAINVTGETGMLLHHLLPWNNRWNKLTDEITARGIVSFAEEQGLDQDALDLLSEAMGHLRPRHNRPQPDHDTLYGMAVRSGFQENPCNRAFAQ